MKKTYLEIGKIVAAHGVKGDVKVLPWCDDTEMFCEIDEVLAGTAHVPMEIVRARVQNGCAILHVKGIETKDDAEKLRGTILHLHRDNFILEPDTYFISDLIGLRVIDADTNEEYGTLADVQATGANDIYEVRQSDARTFWIPAIADVVVETDIDGGVMKVRLLEGLRDAD